MARRGANDSGLQAELERLYALPPAAFTGARNEIAARLRREGRRDAAAEVKALPRPTASSWAASRLMRLEPVRFRELLAAGRQAREAQRQVLGGGAGASTAAAAARRRDALRNARTAIEELRRRGLELLAASGRKASPAVADRLSADLQALAFTAEAESAIERGWLGHDLEAPGFEVLAGLQAAAGGAVTPSRPSEGPARKLPAKQPVRPAWRALRGMPHGHPGRAAAATGDRRSRGRRPEPRQPVLRTEPRRGRAENAETSPRPGSALERKGPRRRPGREETPPPRRSAPDDAQARLQAVRQRQEQARREREQDRLQQARDRERARLAEAEAEVQHAAAESARLAAAAEAAERDAAAAERDAADARRRAGEARREAERARRGAERARQLLDPAGERLAAARAAAAGRPPG